VIVMKFVVFGTMLVENVSMRMLATMAVFVLFSVNYADIDPARRYQLSKPARVILRPALERDEQDLAFEADTPMKIPSVIAEFDSIADGTRFDAQPALGGSTHHDRAIAVDEEDRTIEQPLLPWQGNRKFLTAAGGGQQAPTRKVRHGDIDDIDSTSMLKVVNCFGERQIESATQDMINAQHRDALSGSRLSITLAGVQPRPRRFSITKTKKPDRS
jgi:hypothetical protein